MPHAWSHSLNASLCMRHTSPEFTPKVTNTPRGTYASMQFQQASMRFDQATRLRSILASCSSPPPTSRLKRLNCHSSAAARLPVVQLLVWHDAEERSQLEYLRVPIARAAEAKLHWFGHSAVSPLPQMRESGHADDERGHAAGRATQQMALSGDCSHRSSTERSSCERKACSWMNGLSMRPPLLVLCAMAIKLCSAVWKSSFRWRLRRPWMNWATISRIRASSSCNTWAHRQP